jgi:hypothetical protein
MEHRITLTIAGLGATADDSDRLLEILLDMEPDAGARGPPAPVLRRPPAEGDHDRRGRPLQGP